MKIFTEIKDSIYNKEYYKEIIEQKSTKESIKYLARISFIVALFMALTFIFSFPGLIGDIKGGIKTFTKDYPEDLIFSINKGNLSINRPEPYSIDVPIKWKESKDFESINTKNLLVVNTTESFNIEKFNEYSTFSLLTKTNLIIKQPDSREIKIFSLSEIGDIYINKSWVLEKENYFLKILPYIIAFIIPLSIGMMFVGIFILNIILIFLYALFVWLMFKVKKINITYKKSYQVALHASTLVIFLSLFNQYLGIFNNTFFKLFLVLMIVYINLFINKNISNQNKKSLIKREDVPNLDMDTNKSLE